MKGVSLKPTTRGLLPFEAKDKESYYIDEAVVEVFFRSLKKNKFVFLTGDRASGKTSFLNCIALEQVGEYLGKEEHQWETAWCRPGLDPVKNLAYAIAGANVNTRKPDVAQEIEELLRNGSNGMVNVFYRYPIRQQKSLLLVIDHLEDIFFLEKLDHDTRHTADTSASIQTLINLLWTFEKQSVFNVYIVVAFSSMFRERMAEYPKLLDLAQKYDFRFEGVGVSEVDKVIDKLVSPSLRSYSDILRLKKIYKDELLASQENGTLSPSWRFFLNHSLRRTLTLWNRGFTYIKNAISKEDSLKTLLKSKYLLLLVNDLLKNENAQGDQALDDKSEELWNKLEKDQQQQLVKIIRSARAQGGSYSIIACYKAGGGMENSIMAEASELFAYNARYEKQAEFLAKSITTKNASFRPLQYVAIRKLIHGTVGFDREGIQRFINHCGDGGLGLFQIISSSRIEERLNNIADAEHIDDEAVIAIRNPDLFQKNTPFDEWAQNECECISGYLMYAQISKEDTEAYPTTLRFYADALLEGTPLNKDRHSAIIHEFLRKGSAWANLHTGPKTQFASFEETRAFIDRGVRHWQLTRKSDENRKKEEERIRRVKINLAVLVFISVVLFGIYTRISVEKHKMLHQLTCLYDDHYRIWTVIYNEYIYALEDAANRGDVVTRWASIIGECNEKLDHESKEVDATIDAIYQESVFDFALHYYHWKEKEDILLGDTIRKNILKRAVSKKFLKSEGEILELEGYKTFNAELLPDEVRDSSRQYFVNCRKCEIP